MTKREDAERFRRSQHDAYVSQHDGQCEVTPFLLARSKAFYLFSLTNQGPLELAHIWGRHGMACDAFCAIIRISHAAHSWAHVGHHPDCSPHDAVEAASLAAKYARHQDISAGPVWHRSERQRVERWYDESPLVVLEHSYRRHWDIPSANAARAACVGYNTLVARVEYLHDNLCDTPFGDITERLVRIVGDPTAVGSR